MSNNLDYDTISNFTNNAGKSNSSPPNSTITENRITFKGIPIKGNLKELAKELNKVGFKKTYREDKLRGSFAGFNDVTLKMVNSNIYNCVTSIVLFIPIKTPEDINEVYDDFKEALENKYSIVRANYKKSRKCSFDTGNGTISIDMGVGKIVIEYLDDMTYYKYQRQLEKEAALKAKIAAREQRRQIMSQEL